MTPLEPGAPDPDEESEGCLSFPGERFPLRRSEEVRVTGIDLDGAPVLIHVTGWRARIMQHEFDHLNGILYIDRLDDSDWKTTQKIARKRGWGKPGQQWMPGEEHLDAGPPGRAVSSAGTRRHWRAPGRRSTTPAPSSARR